MTELRPGRFIGAAGPLGVLSVEGFLDPVPEAPGYEMIGPIHRFDCRARPAGFASGLALIEGGYDGDFGADKVRILREPLADCRVLFTLRQ